MVRRRPAVVISEFEPILREATVNGWNPKCRDNPGPYQDYTERPTKEEAEELCAGCPMMTGGECAEMAIAKKLWGINGGKLYQEGKRIPFSIIDAGGRRRLPSGVRAESEGDELDGIAA